MNSTLPESSDREHAPDPSVPFSLADIFLDAHGLRPFWSIALFLAIWALLRLVIFSIAHVLFPSPSVEDHLIPARAEYVFEGASLLSVLAATWLMARLEGRSLYAYGLSAQRRLRNFAAGIAWGAALLSLLVFSLHAYGLLVFDGRLLIRAGILRYAVVWAIGFLLVALAEETLLRGYLQFTFTRALTGILRHLTPAYTDAAAFWTSALILSITFGAMHRNNPSESPIGLVAAMLVGLIFCLTLWRSGSLWWAIGFHAAWDWAQSFLYGVPDSGLLVQGRLFATHATGRAILSGGPTGPEGSALIFPVLLVACAAVVLTLPGYEQPASSPPDVALQQIS